MKQNTRSVESNTFMSNAILRKFPDTKMLVDKFCGGHCFVINRRLHNTVHSIHLLLAPDTSVHMRTRQEL